MTYSSVLNLFNSANHEEGFEDTKGVKQNLELFIRIQPCDY